MKINLQVKKFKHKMSMPHHCLHFEIDEDSMLIELSVFIELSLQNK